MMGPMNAINGNIVTMRTTNDRHFGDVRKASGSDDISGSFADALNKALGSVNDQQIESEKLTQKMIHNPGSVDIHSVMIAGQKAEVSLTFAKTVRDEAIRGFRELMNLR